MTDSDVYRLFWFSSEKRMPALASSTWRKNMVNQFQFHVKSCEVLQPFLSDGRRCVAKQQEMNQRTKQKIWRHFWLGKDLWWDLRWVSMLTFSLTSFQGFMWATAFSVQKKDSEPYLALGQELLSHTFLDVKPAGLLGLSNTINYAFDLTIHKSNELLWAVFLPSDNMPTS